jgi:beta-lactamase regulating signal transducer with metallopeptidase domain
MSLTQLLIQVAARGTLLLLLTALAGLAFRRASAATRHLIWTGGLVASLIVPLISVPEPALPVLPSVAPVSRSAPLQPTPEVWSGTMAAPAPVVEKSAVPKAEESSAFSSTSPTPPLRTGDSLAFSDIAEIAAVAWMVGLILVFLRLVASSIAIARLARRAVAVSSPEWLATIRSLKSVHSHRVIRYLESSEVSTPCTWGTLSPTVLLPAVGAGWSGEERRQVVVHELAHVRRFDCATQVLATLAVALNWFNPLAWLAQRHSRVAREQACDDAVLAAGGAASTYANLLLVAAAPEGGRWLPAEAQAMARRSQIGDRLLAVLDPARRRNPVDRRSVGWISATAFAAAIPVLSVGFQPATVPSPAQSVVRIPATEAAGAPDTSRPRLSLPSTPAAPWNPTPALSAPSILAVTLSDLCGRKAGSNKESSSSSSYTDDDGNDQKNWFTMTIRGKNCSVRIEGKGKIRFTPFEDDVMTMSEGGRFEIETEDGSVTRNYRVINRNGALERRYQVNDRDASVDGDALKWRAGLILEFIRRSGYDAAARAERILKEKGMDALVQEIGEIHSDGVRALYLKAGMRSSRLSAADATSLLILVQEIGSDGDRASVLKTLPETLLSDQKVQDAYADAAKGIGSDGDKSSVLMSAIRSGKLTAGSCEWVVGLASSIGSDGDRSAVLMSATESLQWNSSCVRRSLEATRDIGSDGDKAATLIRFLERHGLPGELVPTFFSTTATIGSDGDHSNVLRRVIGLGNVTDAAVEGMLVDSRRIGSDGDHSSVLVAAARRGLIKSERMKTLYRQSAEGIGSDGEREAAIRALDRS